MVNELNKSSSFEADELAERLAASNRQLHEMQEEHRQLLQEMEMLRQRATQLARLNELQQQQKQQLHQQKQRLREREHLQQQQLQQLAAQEQASEPLPQQQQAADQQVSQEAPEELQKPQEQPQPLQAPEQPQPQQEPEPPVKTYQQPVEAAPSTETDSPKDDGEDDPESMDYITAKLAEIAALKAQYRRVQTLINTTNMIETHMAAKAKQEEAGESPTPPPTGASDAGSRGGSPKAAAPVEAGPEPESSIAGGMSALSAAARVDGAAVNAANEELLGAMLNMFNDFNSDLRSQVDSVRAERERIKTLKETLLQRRKDGGAK